MIKNTAAFLFIMITVVTFSNVSAGYHPRPDLKNVDVVPNMIIIKFRPAPSLQKSMTTTGIAAIDRILHDNGITKMERVFNDQSMAALKKKAKPAWTDQIYFAYYDGGASPFEVSENLSGNPAVEYAEPKYLNRLAQDTRVPNDSLYSQQTFFPLIKAPEAWQLTRGEQGSLVIAVIDGGTQIIHPDLSANIWTNVNEIPGNDVDDDHNGYTDDVYGWNFADNSGNPTGLPATPLNANHGTHTGGLISAVTDNHRGTAGTSWNARLMAVNTSDPVTDNTIRFGYEGIWYAATNGASVISCSWGRGGGASQFEQEVIDSTTALGAVVVAAAGNGSSNQSFYPASYNHVFSVAATDNSDKKASFSNFGTTVDVSSPGTSILSTYNFGNYGIASGTSMACPIAAGIVGLVKTAHPAWSGVQAAEQVRVTSDKIDALNPSFTGLLGHGRVNAYRALSETHPSIRLTGVRYEDSDQDGIIERGENVKVYFEIINYLAAASNITLTLTSGDENVTVTSAQVTIPQIGSMEEQSLSAYTEFTVSSGAPSGHRAIFSVNITGDNYQDRDHFDLMIMPNFVNSEINNIQTTVTNTGRIGFPIFNDVTEGLGFHYEFGPNLLFEGAIITGTSVNQISNAARGQDVESDQDFTISVDGDIQSDTPGSVSDMQTSCLFEDTQSDNPMYIRIKQESFAWKNASDGDFILLKYTVYNLNPSDLTNFHFGLFFDWDLDETSYDTNVADWDATRKMGYAYDNGSGPGTYAGVALLSPGDVSYRAIYNDENDPSRPEWGLYDGFSDQEKWQSISGGTVVTKAGPADISFVLAAGPFDIPGSGSQIITFVLAAGENLAGLQTHVDAAAAKWQEILPTDVDPAPHTPLVFNLEQNYPNPFNPVTRIAFSLPESGHAELKIYSLTGELVATVYAGEMNAGRHVLSWDAGGYASGVYLYRLSAGNKVLTRKMVLLR